MKSLIVKVIKRIAARFPQQFPLIWSIRRQVNKVAITFDDGPTLLTPRILDCLVRYNVKATFFVLGNQVERHPDLLVRILADGHEIGIHGYDHSMRDFYGQVKCCNDALSKYNISPRIVRTPGCVIHPVLTLRLWLNGYRSIVYSFDTHDSMRLEGKWSGPPPEYSQVAGGDIVLMHDDNEQCVAELPILLQKIGQHGINAVTVSELINAKRKPRAI